MLGFKPLEIQRQDVSSEKPNLSNYEYFLVNDSGSKFFCVNHPNGVLALNKSGITYSNTTNSFSVKLSETQAVVISNNLNGNYFEEIDLYTNSHFNQSGLSNSDFLHDITETNSSGLGKYTKSIGNGSNQEETFVKSSFHILNGMSVVDRKFQRNLNFREAEKAKYLVTLKSPVDLSLDNFTFSDFPEPRDFVNNREPSLNVHSGQTYSDLFLNPTKDEITVEYFSIDSFKNKSNKSSSKVPIQNGFEFNKNFKISWYVNNVPNDRNIDVVVYKQSLLQNFLNSRDQTLYPNLNSNNINKLKLELFLDKTLFEQNLIPRIIENESLNSQPSWTISIKNSLLNDLGLLKFKTRFVLKVSLFEYPDIFCVTSIPYVVDKTIFAGMYSSGGSV